MFNVRYAHILAIASIALAPVAAHSKNDERTQACVDTFIAQHFPGQSPVVKIMNDTSSVHSVVYYGMPFELVLSATNKSGNLLVTAVCTARHGLISLTNETRSPLIAAR